jgi:hypothetical protein
LSAVFSLVLQEGQSLNKNIWLVDRGYRFVNCCTAGFPVGVGRR